MTRITIETKIKGLPEGGSVTNHFSTQTTHEAESVVLELTSNGGYSNTYTDVYAGPSLAETPNRYVLVYSPGTIYLSHSSTEQGIRLSSGQSVFPSNSSVLYVQSAGSSFDVEIKSL